MLYVPLTQHKRPDGRTVDGAIGIPDSASGDSTRKLNEILKLGLHFTAEVLADGQIALTLTSNKEEFDYKYELVENAPATEFTPSPVGVKVLEIIEQFDKEDYWEALQNHQAVGRE